MSSTEELLTRTIAFHGGADRWQKYQTLQAHTKMGGITWALKGHAGAVDDLQFTAKLHHQQATYDGLFSEHLQSEFTPGRVALKDKNQVIDELLNPRDSFKGHTMTTPWTRLQLVYFASYALWNYTTAPFNFLLPGMQTKEIEPWREKGQTWRRLEVIYPDSMARHSKRQVFYFTSEGRLTRFDYWPDVLANAPATQVVEEYRDFDGLKIATKRRIYALNEADNSYNTDPILISIDILDVKFKAV